jgi:signal transduction histidine kinase/ligand-binding sensor domain-containing protein
MLCISVLFSFNPKQASAQDLQLKFKHLEVDNGLSQGTITGILQDKMGFMWFATEMGIYRYDGAEFVNYRHDAADTGGLPSNYILKIFEDSYCILWLGTPGSGLCRFDRKREIFKNYTFNQANAHSISSNDIRCLFEDSHRNLWIGTSGGGLNMYDRKTDSFIRFYHDSASANDIGSNYITGIGEDKQGFLWLASSEGLITRYNTATQKGTFYSVYDRNLTDRTTTTFGHLYVDLQDNIWYCTENGLYFYDQKTREFTHFQKGPGNKNLNENAVSDVTELGGGIFLIGTDHGGVNIYNQNTGTFTYHKNRRYDPSTISNDQIYTVYKSPEGVIWIGNYNGGINIYDPLIKKFSIDTDLPRAPGTDFSVGSVLSIAEDNQQNLWLGYDGQGIDVYNLKTHTIKHLTHNPGNINTISSDNVVDIFKSRNGDMWIGTYLEGLTKIDGITGKYTHYQFELKNKTGIGGTNVWSVCEGDDGIMWIGFMGDGVDRFDTRNNRFYHYTHNPADSHSLSDNSVYKVFRDRDGNIWVSTQNGLSLYDSNSDHFINYVSGNNVKSGIYGNCVYDIFQDAKGRLWVGTEQALNLYNPFTKGFEHFKLTEQAGGTAVLSITADNRDNLWISTNVGLIRFSTVDHSVRHYDEADGMLTDEFNYVSSLRCSDGRIFLGNKSGFNFFDPASIKDNSNIPPVYITALEVEGQTVDPRSFPSITDKNISFTRSVKLNPRQSVFTIHFAALNFSNSHKNLYSYILEGFDKQWSKPSNKHEVSYTNLNPGRYTFKVKGSNNDFLWNPKVTTLEIIVLPPWWKSWWFRVLLYALLIILMVSIFYLRLHFYEKQKNKLTRLVSDRTLQLEEVAVALEEKQEEINSQNEKLLAQRDELANTNRMLTEQKLHILAQNSELDFHRNQLETIVEERTKELIEAKNKAEEADRLKSSFLANLSHEIRTPLNAILGFSSLLSEKNLTDTDRQEYNRIIQGSSNTLLELINDILDISKIEAGQLELDLRSVSLEMIINDLAGIFDMFMKRDDLGLNKQVELKVNIEESLQKAHIVTDSLRVTQVISNLINNAIKFTTEGFIEVGCSQTKEGGMLRFYVRDTGVGIRAEHQQLVFERFRKLEDDNLQLHRGTGLGLAISYQLVHLLGGTMWLESEYGKGSTFFFTIPLMKGSAGFSTVMRKKTEEIMPDFGYQVILVAEDDDSNFNYLDKILKNARIRVLRAVNGKEVIDLVIKHLDVKVVLMDIKMPVMDGIEALHALRKSGNTIPVIAQTAYALSDEVVKLKKEGFDEYISKPIKRQELYSILVRYLQ